MPSSSENNNLEHSEGTVEQYGFSESYNVTVSTSTIRQFVPVMTEFCPCFLADTPAEQLFHVPGVNLSHFLDSLYSLKKEAESIVASGLTLDCLSVREPYSPINHRIEPNVFETLEEDEDFESFMKSCNKFFGLRGNHSASNFISWSPKLYFPLVHEQAVFGSPECSIRFGTSGGFEGKFQEVSEAFFVENSKEFLHFYYDEANLGKGVFERYTRFCDHTFSSLFPFPEELTELLYTDVVNVPPSLNTPNAAWTFLLFSLAWKLPNYSRLRAKRASSSENGQFVVIGDTSYSMEFVRQHNLLYLKEGVSSAPMLPEPIPVKRIVSVLENLFIASVEAISLLIREVESIIGKGVLLKNHNATIKEEHLKNEKCFCNEIVAPLLRAMDYKNIRYTHGSNEFGKDFVAVDGDKTHEYYVAFVVKAGDISGSATSKKLDEITAQIESAFTVPYTPPDTMQEVNISKVIVIVSGKYLDNAITRLSAKYKKECRLGYLLFWDGTNIDALIKKHGI